MRLHAEQREVALDGAPVDARLCRRAPDAPVGRMRGLGAQHGTEQPGDVIIAMRAGAAGARGIVQSREPQVPIAAAPVAHHGPTQVDGSRDVAICLAGGRKQDDARATHQPGRQRARARNLRQGGPLRLGERNLEGTRAATGQSVSGKEMPKDGARIMLVTNES